MVFIQQIPRQYKNAKKIKKIFYDEMLEMASLGFKSYATNFCTRCKTE
jgi:aspartokinase